MSPCTQGEVDSCLGLEQKKSRKRKTMLFKHTYRSSKLTNLMGNPLPTEITLDIITRLPVESILQCRRVCKTWRNLVRDLYFIDMHLRRSMQSLYHGDDHQNCHNISNMNSICNNGSGGAAGNKVGFVVVIKLVKEGAKLYYGEYDENIDEQIYHGECDKIINGQQHCYKILTRINHPLIEHVKDSTRNYIVGSCNGLICFSKIHSKYRNYNVYICNPITREFATLPRLIERDSFGMVSGFGYISSTNEYKIVSITFHKNYQGRTIGKVQVYTLGSGTGWRGKEEILYKLLNTPSAVFAKETLYWLSRDLKIVAFNLATEEFYEVLSPPCFFPGGCYDPIKHCFRLRELGRCLCVVHKEQGKVLKIWSLKKTNNSTTYDIKEQEDKYHSWTWILEFSMSLEGKTMYKYEPFTLTKEGEVLILYDRTILSRYDPKSSKLVKLVHYHGDKCLKFYQASPHVNSFVSLKALGEKCKTRRKYMCKDDNTSLKTRLVVQKSSK